ncbi:MAG: hypothetical protein M1819_002372 [Sarea resinae]|nr:MAG: hypothetical protein M1819_002372 [Sarea resinae]
MLPPRSPFESPLPSYHLPENLFTPTPSPPVSRTVSGGTVKSQLENENVNTRRGNPDGSFGDEAEFPHLRTTLGNQPNYADRVEMIQSENLHVRSGNPDKVDFPHLRTILDDQPNDAGLAEEVQNENLYIERANPDGSFGDEVDFPHLRTILDDQPNDAGRAEEVLNESLYFKRANPDGSFGDEIDFPHLRTILDDQPNDAGRAEEIQSENSHVRKGNPNGSFSDEVDFPHLRAIFDDKPNEVHIKRGDPECSFDLTHLRAILDDQPNDADRVEKLRDDDSHVESEDSVCSFDMTLLRDILEDDQPNDADRIEKLQIDNSHIKREKPDSSFDVAHVRAIFQSQPNVLCVEKPQSEDSYIKRAIRDGPFDYAQLLAIFGVQLNTDRVEKLQAEEPNDAERAEIDHSIYNLPSPPKDSPCTMSFLEQNMPSVPERSPLTLEDRFMNLGRMTPSSCPSTPTPSLAHLLRTWASLYDMPAVPKHSPGGLEERFMNLGRVSVMTPSSCPSTPTPSSPTPLEGTVASSYDMPAAPKHSPGGLEDRFRRLRQASKLTPTFSSLSRTPSSPTPPARTAASSYDMPAGLKHRAGSLEERFRRLRQASKLTPTFSSSKTPITSSPTLSSPAFTPSPSLSTPSPSSTHSNSASPHVLPAAVNNLNNMTNQEIVDTLLQMHTQSLQRKSGDQVVNKATASTVGTKSASNEEVFDNQSVEKTTPPFRKWLHKMAFGRMKESKIQADLIAMAVEKHKKYRVSHKFGVTVQDQKQSCVSCGYGGAFGHEMQSHVAQKSSLAAKDQQQSCVSHEPGLSFTVSHSSSFWKSPGAGAAMTGTLNLVGLGKHRNPNWSTDRSDTCLDHHTQSGPVLTHTTIKDDIVDGPRRERYHERSRIIWEIITSEESYVADLKVLTNVYNTIFSSSDCFSPLIRLAVQQSTEEILDTHEALLREIALVVPDIDLDPASMGEPQLAARLAGVFAKYTKRFRAYEEYGARYELAMGDAIATNVAKASPMVSYDRGLEALAVSLASVDLRALVGGKSVGLYDLLIKPVQRLCRYPLLFAELKAKVPASEAPAAHHEIEIFLGRMREVVEDVNMASSDPMVKRRIQRTWLATGAAKAIIG